MTPAMLKDTLRTMRKTMSRFLSIFAIVALGVGFFAGVRATGSDMRLTADDYFDRTQTADVHLLSTLGLSQQDVTAVRAIPGVSGVLPSHHVDLLVLDQDNFVARVLSLPKKELDDPDYLNQLRLLEGRLPQEAGECVIDKRIAQEMGFTLGRILTFAPGSTDTVLEDWLDRQSYTIVGIAESPLYIDMTKRGNTTIGNGSIKAFVYLPQEDFVPDYYTDLYLTYAPALGEKAYTDGYNQSVEELVRQLEALENTRAPALLAEVKEEAQGKLDDARLELADGKREMEEKLAEAAQTIADAEQKLRDGEVDYRKGLADYNEEISKAQKELDDAKAELEEGWEAYREGRDALRAGEKELRESLPKLQAAQQQLTALEQSLPALKGAVEALPAGTPAAGAAQVAAALNALAGADGASLGLGNLLFLGSDPANPTVTLQGKLALLGSGEPPVEGALDSYLAQMQQTVADANQQYDQGVLGLEEGQKELNAAHRELEKGRDSYNEGLAEFRTQKADAQKKLDDAQEKIADGKAELADGKAEYEEKKRDAQADVDDAEQKLADAQQELDDLELPEWYIQDRYDSNPSYGNFGDDANRIDNVAAIFPVFFLGVAALVCLTTMTRMVEEQRGQIGTAKALGYTGLAIAGKYLIYAGTASLLGSLAGLAVGFWLFPTVIYNAYRIMYDMPDVIAPFWGTVGAASCLAAVGVSLGVTAAACMGELRSVPAQIMRPKSPKAGKRVLLEYIGPLWRRMSFIQKVTVRNLFRYKKRVLMTVIGIAGCTALMLAGFGLNDAINDIVKNQYVDIFHYDLMVVYSGDGKAENLKKLRDTVSSLEGVTAWTDQYMQSMSALCQTKPKTLDVNLMVTPAAEEGLDRYITLRQRLGHAPVAVQPRGAVISEKLSQLFELEVGDTLVLQDPDGVRRELSVTGITENYASHFVYLTPGYYQEVFGKAPEYNSFLVDLADSSLENSIGATLLENSDVLLVNFTSAIRSEFGNISVNFQAVVAVLILSAGLLAFVVLYNLTNINITERIREIATLKVLGFYDREVSAYIYRENIALTLIGAGVGLLLGIALTRFVVVTAEIDAIMFGRTIYPPSYAIAAALTLVFSLLVNLVMHFRLKKVNMVESMKSVD